MKINPYSNGFIFLQSIKNINANMNLQMKLKDTLIDLKYAIKYWIYDILNKNDDISLHELLLNKYGIILQYHTNDSNEMLNPSNVKKQDILRMPTPHHYDTTMNIQNIAIYNGINFKRISKIDCLNIADCTANILHGNSIDFQNSIGIIVLAKEKIFLKRSILLKLECSNIYDGNYGINSSFIYNFNCMKLYISWYSSDISTLQVIDI